MEIIVAPIALVFGLLLLMGVFTVGGVRLGGWTGSGISRFERPQRLPRQIASRSRGQRDDFGWIL